MNTIRLCERCFPAVLADCCERLIEHSILQCERCGAETSGVRVFPAWAAFAAAIEAWARATGVELPPVKPEQVERVQGEFGSDAGISGIPV